MTPELLVSVSGVEVWHGDSLDAEVADGILGGRKADLLAVDAPYSDTTHSGHRQGKVTADRAATFGETAAGTTGNRKAVARYAAKVASGLKERSDLDYDAWSHDDVERFVDLWSAHVHGWWASITDDILGPHWRRSFDARELYSFAPLPWVEIGSRVRMLGDGPSGWTCWLMVARPRSAPWSKWGTLRGAYIGPAQNHQNRPDRITGGKSVRLTCELLRDYSRGGALVVDPCLGGGTTALAAMKTGRRCIGIERDRARAELCAELVTAEARGTTRLAMRRGQRSLFELEEAK